MIALYITASIVTALMMIIDIFILAYPHLPIKKYPLFYLLFLVLFFTMDYFTFYPMLFFILAAASILLVKFTKQLYSVFYIPLGYIVNCIVINLLTLAANILWNLSVKEFNADKFLIVIFSICTIVVSCPIIYLIRQLFQRYLIHIFDNMSKKLLTFIVLTLLLCAALSAFFLACC